MRVLIAGGSGLIGLALATELAGHGYEVVVLSRRPSAVLPAGLPEGVRVAGWDGRTAEGWGGLVDGARAVVNLAGSNLAEGRWTAERKKSILQSRLDAGRAVVQAVQQAAHRPPVVIQASAVGYYGPHGDEELVETAPAGSDFLAQVCVEWERSTADLLDVAVRQLVIRSGLVLSGNGGSLSRMLLPFRLFVGGPLGSGRQWFSWIHIADEVAALRFLIETEGVLGPFNLTAPLPLSNRDFARALGRATRRPAFMPVPASVLRLVFGEMSAVLLEGQRVLPRRLLALGFRFRFPTLDGALRDLLGSSPQAAE